MWLQIAVGVATGLSLIGQYQERRFIKQADKAGRRAKKIRDIKERIDLNSQTQSLISEKIATQALRGIVMNEFTTKHELDTVIDQYDEAVYFADLEILYDLNARDFRLAGALAANTAKMGQTLLSGIATGYMAGQSATPPATTSTGTTLGGLGAGANSSGSSIGSSAGQGF